MKKIFVFVVVVGVAGVAGVAFFRGSGGEGGSYKMDNVTRGDLTVTISATGTVEPEEVVDVGAQVAGKIEYFGKDTEGKEIDYGSTVDNGTVLAHIDESMYKSEADQAFAQVEQAKANVLRAEADLEQMQAKFLQAENNWKRAQELGPSRALSATDYDSYKAAFETAKATLAVGRATIVQNQKSVIQAEALHHRMKTNLGYCTIISPVKGVIIDRRVNIGQTVVASFNAPSLFLIAKDLRKMEVWTSVNEADIGSIRPGQAVSFTVDAFPTKTFRGVVGKIRLNASMNSNVVTYTVEIHTDNSDGTLLPYLTANARFEVDKRKNVLKVPNSALRWKPATEEKATTDQPAEKEDKPKRQRKSADDSGEKKEEVKKGMVWTLEANLPKPIDVVVGLSDGVETEIVSGDVKEGTEIIVGENIESSAEQTTNPFAPRIFGRRR